jgi:hypothetical protein
LMQDLNYPMVNMIVHFRLYIQFFLYKLSPLLDSIFDFELDVQHVHCKYPSIYELLRNSVTTAEISNLYTCTCS